MIPQTLLSKPRGMRLRSNALESQAHKRHQPGERRDILMLLPMLSPPKRVPEDSFELFWKAS